MVVLTPAQQHLIRWLKVMGVKKDEMLGIMSKNLPNRIAYDIIIIGGENNVIV